MSEQKFNILHSGSPEKDVQSLIGYINDFGIGLGLSVVEVDDSAVSSAVTGMNNMPWEYGADAASPFKKVAAFVTNFSIHRPIATEFPRDKFKEVADHQNAIVAYHLAVDSLHGAVIECPYRGSISLNNRITVSWHFWQEFISAISQSNPVEHFHFVALVFEALCYEANPKVSYKSLYRAFPGMVV